MRSESQSEDLLAAPTLAGRAEAYEVSARIFTSSLQVAERMGVPKAKAVQFANDQARRACGIDWVREVKGAAPAKGGPPTVHAGAVATFIEAWHSGAIGLPWGPALAIDVHNAFLRWAERAGEEVSPIRVFVPCAHETGLLRSRRTSWRECRKIRSPSSFLVPTGHEPGSAYIADWLGNSVTAFRRAAKAAGLV